MKQSTLDTQNPPTFWVSPFQLRGVIKWQGYFWVINTVFFIVGKFIVSNSYQIFVPPMPSSCSDSACVSHHLPQTNSKSNYATSRSPFHKNLRFKTLLNSARHCPNTDRVTPECENVGRCWRPWRASATLIFLPQGRQQESPPRWEFQICRLIQKYIWAKFPTRISMVLSKWIITPIKVGCKSRK